MYVPLFFLVLMAVVDGRPVMPLVLAAVAANLAVGWACRQGRYRKALGILALADLVCGIQFAIFCLLAMMDHAPREALPILFVLATGIGLCWQLYRRPPATGVCCGPSLRGGLAAIGLVLVQICAPSTAVLLLLCEPIGGAPWSEAPFLVLALTVPLYYAPLWWLIASGAGARDRSGASQPLPPMEEVLRDHALRYPDERSALARGVLRWERHWFIQFGLRFEDVDGSTLAVRELFLAAWNDKRRPRWREISGEYLTSLADEVFPPWFRPGDAAEGEGLDPEQAPAPPSPRLRLDEALNALPEAQASIIRAWLSDERAERWGPVTAAPEMARRFREGVDRLLADVAADFPARPAPSCETAPSSDEMEAASAAPATDLSAG